MENRSRRDNLTQSVTISILISLLIFITGITLIYIENPGYDISLAQLAGILKENKLTWILISQIIILPAFAYFILSKPTHEISNLENSIGWQNKKFRAFGEYVEKLIHEDFQAELSLKEKDDKIGSLLINLRNTLKKNKELFDKQRKEDEARNWHAEGLAKFSEILRSNTDDMEKMAFNVIKNLSNYVNAIQGGFFLFVEEESEKYLDLIAFYAYGRKKFADKRLKWGKGLIGTAAVERKTIHMDKLPDSYINVTSGLGQANPNNLIVCPMIANDELFGVIEIASLSEFTKDHISFIEKAAESTALTISSVRTSMRTAKLLEESKAQAQALSAQEEEMRQNMEELQATQEEASRQANRFMKLENTVNHTMIRAEYNTDGILLYANTKFLEKLEYNSNRDVEGKHISLFLSRKDDDWFNRIWAKLKAGGRHFEGYMKHITRTGKDLWTMATYTCIRDDNDEVEKILFLALDTTEQKKISLNLEGIVDAVNRSSIRIEFGISGNIQSFNESFLYVFKYSESDISHLTVFDLIDTLELEMFNKKWENIVNGMNFQGHFKVKSKDEEEKWIRGAFSAVYDMYNEVEKVIYIGQDITNEKLMEIESKRQNETLKKQEQLLRESEKELSRKLREAKAEMIEQYKEIERIKIRNERTLEGALDAIITTSNSNKILFYNKAAEILLGYTKDEVMGNDVSILFPDSEIKDDEFVSKYVAIGDNKIVGIRKEVKIKTKSGEEIPVLFLLSKAQVEQEITYTAFIQTIEVELF